MYLVVKKRKCSSTDFIACKTQFSSCAEVHASVGLLCSAALCFMLKSIFQMGFCLLSVCPGTCHTFLNVFCALAKWMLHVLP